MLTKIEARAIVRASSISEPEKGKPMKVKLNKRTVVEGERKEAGDTADCREAGTVRLLCGRGLAEPADKKAREIMGIKETAKATAKALTGE